MRAGGQHEWRLFGVELPAVGAEEEEEGRSSYNAAPLVPPQCGSLPLAVLHKQAVAELRMELAEWLVSLLPLGSQVEHVQTSIQSLAEHHSQTTMRRAFDGKLPIYDVSFEVSI